MATNILLDTKAHLNEWICHSIIYTIANQVAFQETQRKYSFQAR